MTVVKLAGRDESYKADVVARLEELLEIARRGEILSVTYSCERPGGLVTFGSTIMQDRYLLLGFLDHQKWLVNKSLDFEAVDSDLLEGA